MKKIGKFLQKILYLILILLVAACAGILYNATKSPEDQFKMPELGLFGNTVSDNSLSELSGNNLQAAIEEMTEAVEEVLEEEPEAEPADAKPLTAEMAALIAADRAGLADERIVISRMPAKTMSDGTYYVYEDALTGNAETDADENAGIKILIRAQDGMSTVEGLESATAEDITEAEDSGTESADAENITASEGSETVAPETEDFTETGDITGTEDTDAQDLPKIQVPILDERVWQAGNAKVNGASVYSTSGKMEIDRSVGTGSFLIQGVKLKMNFGEAMTQIFDNNRIYEKVPGYRDDRIIATTAQSAQGRDALLMGDQLMFGKECYILYDFNKDISGRQLHVLSPRIEGIKVMFREEIPAGSALEKMELMLGSAQEDHYAGLHTYNWYLGEQHLQLRCIRSEDGKNYVADAIVLSKKED